jgi:hypothetical protein
MSDISIDHIMLKKLYNKRLGHYQYLNYSEWLFALIKVEKALFATDKTFYLTDTGRKYFELQYYKECDDEV